MGWRSSRPADPVYRGRGGIGSARTGSSRRVAVLLPALLRVTLATLGGWVVAVSSVLAIAFLAGGERPSSTDMRGLFGASLVAVALLVPFVYLPGLLWLRWFRRGVASVPAFVLTSAVALNVPVFVLLATRAARAVVTPHEAVMFSVILAAVGAIFGRSLARALGAASAAERS